MPKSFFRLTPAPRGTHPVISGGSIRRPDASRQLLILLPTATAARLAYAVAGPHGPAIVGLIEYALDELDRQHKTLIIENREPKK